MAELSQPPPESCFFTPTLLLRSAATAQPDAPCTIAATLAARLCQLNRHGGRRRGFSISAQGRLERARQLLQDAAAGSWNQANDEEAWTLLTQEWEWVSRAPYVRQLLIGWATELGAAVPEQAASAVLAAIPQELLPLLRARTYILSEPTPAAVPSLLQGVTETTEQPLTVWQELALVLVHEEAPDPRLPLARCTRALARPELRAELRPVLVAFYLHQFGRYCDAGSWHSEDDIALLKEYGDQLERLAQDGEPSLGVSAARGRAQRLLGMALLGQQLRITAIDLALVHLSGPPRIRLALAPLWRALALGDDGVTAELKGLGPLYQRLSTLGQKQQAPAKQAYLRSAQAQLAAAQNDAESFLLSTEGLNLRAQRLAAEAAGEQEVLPLREALRRLLAPPPAAAVVTPPARRAFYLWLTWALSSRDAAYKVAAAVGILALLHGGTIGVRENWRAAADKRRYDRVLHSVRMQDHDATVRAADAFLRAAARRDVRVPQVLEFLDRAAAVEALRRGQTGRGAEVATLLEAHQDIRKHWSSKGRH